MSIIYTSLTCCQKTKMKVSIIKTVRNRKKTHDNLWSLAVQ